MGRTRESKSMLFMLIYNTWALDCLKKRLYHVRPTDHNIFTWNVRLSKSNYQYNLSTGMRKHIKPARLFS
ncbi:hypothetical protein Patl1_08842 [Pistacia atlantica]|uniref:Uncharacterized protein n=1 Tax=Pistacia atlantica TaxID=434234 RepID=A0ACC1AII3_9ROSI|nr:hypothetical protein Patl1_08842 [Pistacia atlantica]